MVEIGTLPRDKRKGAEETKLPAGIYTCSNTIKKNIFHGLICLINLKSDK